MHEGDRFASYTSLSIPHPVVWNRFTEEDPGQKKASAYMRTFTLPGVAAIFAHLSDKAMMRTYRHGLTDPSGFTDNDLYWYQETFETAADARGPLKYYKMKFKNHKSNELFADSAPKIDIPVLLIWSEGDKYSLSKMAPESCEYVTAACSHEVLPGDSHWPHWEHPETVVQRWREFTASED